MENIKILDATLEDIEQVDLIEQNEIIVPWNKETIKNMVGNKDIVFRILKIEKELIGYYSFAKIIDEGHINNIAIKREYQHKGFGSMLMKDMIDIAENLELKGITLEVEINNINAIKLYKKFNFKEEGVRKKYYLNTYDAIIMWRK